MMRDRDDLEAERRHVRRQARLDELGRIDALVAEMRQALVEEAADGAENLQVVGDGGVVERKGHGVSYHSVGCRPHTSPEFRGLQSLRFADQPRSGPTAGCT